MTRSSDDRSAIAQAWVWSSRVTAVALEMALPPAAGYWIDQKLGTRMVFLILGVILGMTVGMMSLLRMTASDKSDSPSDRQPPSERENQGQ